MKRPVQGSNSLFRAGLFISVLAGLKAVTVDAAVAQDFEAGFAAPDDPDLNLEFAPVRLPGDVLSAGLAAGEMAVFGDRGHKGPDAIEPPVGCEPGAPRPGLGCRLNHRDLSWPVAEAQP